MANGQNVIGLKDKDIAKIFDESPRTVTITIMPKFTYDHLMKKLVRCVCVCVCVCGCECVCLSSHSLYLEGSST